jgi:hypothetical protein
MARIFEPGSGHQSTSAKKLLIKEDLKTPHNHSFLGAQKVTNAGPKKATHLLQDFRLLKLLNAFHSKVLDRFFLPSLVHNLQECIAASESGFRQQSNIQKRIG